MASHFPVLIPDRPHRSWAHLCRLGHLFVEPLDDAHRKSGPVGRRFRWCSGGFSRPRRRTFIYRRRRHAFIPRVLPLLVCVASTHDRRNDPPLRCPLGLYRGFRLQGHCPRACHTSAADGPRSLHRDRPCHGVVLVQPLWGQRRRRDRLLEII